LTNILQACCEEDIDLYAKILAETYFSSRQALILGDIRQA